MALTALASAGILIVLVNIGTLVRGATPTDTIGDGVEKLFALIAGMGVCVVLIIVLSRGPGRMRLWSVIVSVVLGALFGAVAGLWLVR
jgi:hypothetical protein